MVKSQSVLPLYLGVEQARGRHGEHGAAVLKRATVGKNATGGLVSRRGTRGVGEVPFDKLCS